ncbi:hypothetical protein Cantr_07755 [Candida viswanathii]|uniref:Uncharacterized protein n=1 Tax=Candida viswanathii TaxID=5486 RepID=A0A367Y098_9ASCO|nr:hypothetical protein Cantr_07755 [Candida viswanathii]
MAITTTTTATLHENTKLASFSKATVDTRQQEIINNLIKLAQQEQANGNTSITSDKLAKLSDLLAQKQQHSEKKESTVAAAPPPKSRIQPKPKYASLVNKFDISKSKSREATPPLGPSKPIKKQSHYYRPNQFSFKKLEFVFINVLENVANLLDNLHLLSNLPMFPKVLNNFLKQTNKIWVLILVFLIRKTISQLLNVIRKIRKVNVEVDLLNSTTPANKSNPINEDLNKKYNKVLKDLRFDKMMLIIELIGNFLDLTFNFIEMNGIELPSWAMSILNFSSMAMTIYRMNKDDEYIDDDITEDLI